jgi:hypothetical protein
MVACRTHRWFEAVNAEHLGNSGSKSLMNDCDLPSIEREEYPQTVGGFCIASVYSSHQEDHFRHFRHNAAISGNSSSILSKYTTARLHREVSVLEIRSCVSIAAKNGAILAGEKEPSHGLRDGLQPAWKIGRNGQLLLRVFLCSFGLSGLLGQPGAVGFARDLENDGTLDQSIQEGHGQRTVG